MSLKDKIIRNTFYLIAGQALGFLINFILTPVIISFTGTEQFGIYALVLGSIGVIGLFDLSFSTAFIKYISDSYYKQEFTALNKVVSTGFVFYVIFSLSFALIAFLLAPFIIDKLNIPQGLTETAYDTFYIALLIFLFATSGNIFISILTSLQKMYLNSVIGIFINILNAAGIITALFLGFGITGAAFSTLISVIISVYVSYALCRKEVKEIKISLSSFSIQHLKEMGKFGMQMQVSRLSGFASEKYDEFLLGYYSSLSSVTYYNLASKISRLGRFIPLQLFQQAAPAAAELSANENHEKIKELFLKASKYLAVSSIPVFMLIITFAFDIFNAWMGPGYSTAAYLSIILSGGLLVNMIISAPGNSIIPYLGKPKYLMYEGLINLILNLILSFVLIREYGIIGAAYGSASAMVISSVYIFITSAKYFKISFITLLHIFLTPLIICGLFTAVYYLFVQRFISIETRMISLIYLIVSSIILGAAYVWILKMLKYLTREDMELFRGIWKKLKIA